jgi:hypothetical protein
MELKLERWMLDHLCARTTLWHSEESVQWDWQSPNARVQRADDEALKLALYPYRPRCNEMLGETTHSGLALHDY